MKIGRVRLAGLRGVNVFFRAALNSAPLAVLFAVVALLPARAVVIDHLSMQKLAVVSDAVALCEELELRDNVIEHQNGIPSTVVARCKVIRVFKGLLETD